MEFLREDASARGFSGEVQRFSCCTSGARWVQSGLGYRGWSSSAASKTVDRADAITITASEPAAAEQALNTLTNIVYNETSFLQPNPSVPAHAPGSAEDLHNGREAVAEIAHRDIKSGHRSRVLVKSKLPAKERLALRHRVPTAVAAYSDSRSAAQEALSGRNSTNGATQYRTRFGDDVSTPVGGKGGTDVSQHFGPFPVANGRTEVIVIGP